MTSLLFDPRHIRTRTCEDLARLGINLRTDYLPLIFSPGEDIALRPHTDIEARAAILNIVQARVFDMPAYMAMRWLLDARVLEDLVADEWQFIATGKGDRQAYSEQLESLYSLAWLLGLVPQLDPSQYCSDSLPSLMPDLRTSEPFTVWKARALTAPRDAVEVAEMLDLYCCLDWMYAEATRRGVPMPGSLDPSLIWHRRWSLEWALKTNGHNGSTAQAWDRVQL